MNGIKVVLSIASVSSVISLILAQVLQLGLLLAIARCCLALFAFSALCPQLLIVKQSIVVLVGLDQLRLLMLLWLGLGQVLLHGRQRCLLVEIRGLSPVRTESCSGGRCLRSNLVGHDITDRGADLGLHLTWGPLINPLVPPLAIV